MQNISSWRYFYSNQTRSFFYKVLNSFTVTVVNTIMLLGPTILTPKQEIGRRSQILGYEAAAAACLSKWQSFSSCLTACSPQLTHLARSAIHTLASSSSLLSSSTVTSYAQSLLRCLSHSRYWSIKWYGVRFDINQKAWRPPPQCRQ